MKPNVTEMLTAVRKVLAETVVPELGSDYVGTQLQYLLMALKDVQRYESLYPRLLEENDDAEEMLVGILRDMREIGRSVSGETVVKAVTVVEGVLAADGARTRYPSFSDVESRNGDLREALAQVIRALHQLETRSAAGDLVDEIRRRIHAHLRKFLDRDAAMGVMVLEE